MIDLHTHSTASDGELSPAELVAAAKESGVSVLALTDHDTVSGLDEAACAAKNAEIIFVPGVELNISWQSGEFHLLGLGLKSICEELEEITRSLQDERKSRNQKILQKMAESGYQVNYDEFVSLFGGESHEDTLGRPHLASYFVQKNLVRKTQAAFDKFLGKSAPFYIGRHGADLDEAIFAIKKSGGVPVIAHPLSLYISWGKIADALREIKSRGVQGLEAWHSGAREADCRRLERLAHELGFFVTAGSDFHGKSIRADRRLGITSGNIHIPERYYYDELLPALENFS